MLNTFQASNVGAIGRFLGLVSYDHLEFLRKARRGLNELVPKVPWDPVPLSESHRWAACKNCTLCQVSWFKYSIYASWPCLSSLVSESSLGKRAFMPSFLFGSSVLSQNLLKAMCSCMARTAKVRMLLTRLAPIRRRLEIYFSRHHYITFSSSSPSFEVVYKEQKQAISGQSQWINFNPIVCLTPPAATMASRSSDR